MAALFCRSTKDDRSGRFEFYLPREINKFREMMSARFFECGRPLNKRNGRPSWARRTMNGWPICILPDLKGKHRGRIIS
jgi:hypothetical protein